MSSSCLFSITIKKRTDFLVLENIVRELLRCDSMSCSFFQSAAYIQLRLAISAYALQKPAAPPPAACILVICNSPFMLALSDDGCTLLVLPTIACTNHHPNHDAPPGPRFSKIARYEDTFVKARVKKN